MAIISLFVPPMKPALKVTEERETKMIPVYEARKKIPILVCLQLFEVQNILDSPRYKDESRDGEFAVGIASGMSTRIDILNREGKLFTLFDTNDRTGFRTFDVGKTSEMHALTFIAKLSSHYKWVESNTLGPVEVFNWKGDDVEPLQEMVLISTRRDVCTLNCDVPEPSPFYLAWPSFPTEHGFLVLTPNYGYGLGRGHAFARSSYRRMGTRDWSDANGMLYEAIKYGWADPRKLGIGGWNEGGYLA
ncbi:hypothetical protein BU17DRAFT_62296 [Hysterangium stoloniferum]|nr:hypothetical protein BU17DRAFT_62296 [Hysterangium stoloniferum]